MAYKMAPTVSAWKAMRDHWTSEALCVSASFAHVPDQGHPQRHPGDMESQSGAIRYQQTSPSEHGRDF